MARAVAAHMMVVSVLGIALCASGQTGPDAGTLLAAQREAMKPLAFMDGVWRGPAWVLLPTGEKHALTETERIGPFLDAAVKVIEGRGYDPDGTVSWNALGIISFDPARGTYSLRSYAQGNTGDFPLTLTADGYTWEIPAGPMTIRYTCVLGDGVWTEVGDRIVPGAEPVRFFEMRLTRVGDTDWPAGDPVSAE